ncbi:Retrovirus-related Pol polyprotein from transposon RE2 [Vitis vinifera]|uniref:Retrovirus-related Pol polyprotein from transposon RE2 n=1 Tax=Vitis vinifera TaxID=29760 RepID=A0A438I154_VITVI|nr:Retrovirus-related Pol polyprotein from transposon RE2 [Vitis vinifera]
MITSEKLVGSENYLSWSASIELWFMGQGYEDHLVTHEADIPEAKRLYTNDIQRLYKVASAIVHISQQDLDLSTYIGQIASLKEEFLTVMPLTPDVGLNKHSLISSSWSLLLLASVRILSLSAIKFLVVHQFRPWMMCLLASFVSCPLKTLPSDSISDSSMLVSHTTSQGGRSGNRGRGQRPHCTYCNKLGHTRDRCYQLHGRPPRTAHVAQSSDSQLPQPLSSSASQASQAFVASVAQLGNASVCFTHTSSLGPWILDSGASDHISGNKDLFSSMTTISALPTVTLANGFQTVAKAKITRTLNCSITFSDKFVTLQDRSTGKTIGIGCESQGLYYLTSDSSPTVCISTDAPLLIHSRLGHPSLSKFQKMDKLSAKAMKCLFLGYSRLQKGYLCYSLETHRYFISADVTFFEDSPFFSTTSESLPVSEVLPLPIVSPSDVVPPRPLQVYHRRPRVAAPLPFAEAPADSLPIPSASPAPALPSPDDFTHCYSESTHEALSHLGWRQAMVDEMAALHSNGTWILLFYPLARLVAKGYTQVYGSDYGDTFSPVAKIASVRLLLFMAAMCSWPLYQLDIKNGFLHGDLAEEVYMEQPPGFVAQGESGLVCRLRRSLYGLKQSPRACVFIWLFMWTTSSLQAVIRMLNPVSGVVLSQRKYALDILEETGMLDCKPIDTPMDPNVKLVLGQGEPLETLGDIDGSHWDVVIRILRYIKKTPGQGVLYENRGHTQVVGYTHADWAGSPTDRRSTSGYCVFIGGNLISWKSKKQDVVVRSSAEVEYRVMALATCELIWLRHLLRELRFGKDEQMKLICDNQAALHIASNPVFHERTKHIEVDCHFIREKIASGCVATSFVNSNDQLADIFTKSLRGPRIKYICNKLGAYDVYAPT